MKKVGITTFYNAYNYGAFLQCFALNKVLESKYKTFIIEYDCKAIKKSYKLIKTNNPKKVVKSFLFIGKNVKRIKKFKKCIIENFHLDSPNADYDIVIAGSDQIWNIELTEGYDKIYSLEYFKNVNKISYASSVGNETLIGKNKELYRKIVNNIEKISVREESVKEALKIITKKDIKVTLDPTLLLEREEWCKYLAVNEIKEKYIFSYFVAVTKENFETLNILSEMMNLKTISYSENPKEKRTIKHCFTDDPFEFITRLKDSEMVFTSSFHATVFSIIFNKRFWVMPPKNKENRIINLLKKLGLENRILYTKDEIYSIEIEKAINYNEVNNRLASLRNDSIEWLFSALQDCKKEGTAQEFYAVKNKDDRKRIDASSGGAFTSLAQKILDEKGTIYGAVYDNDFKVVHARVENKKELRRLYGSKYTQSDLGKIFDRIKEDLASDRKVLFSGTPCQIAALKNSLREQNIENLYLVDIICHGVPQNIFFEEYINYMERKYNSKITEINMRYKSKRSFISNLKKRHITIGSVEPHIMRIKFNNEKEYIFPSEFDIYYQLFDFFIKKGCFHCAYAKVNRNSDITIGDFHEFHSELGIFNDGNGVSLLIVNTNKGRQIFSSIKDEFYIEKKTKEECLQPALEAPAEKPRLYENFNQDYKEYGFTYVVKKYTNHSLKIKIKVILYKLHMLQKVRIFKIRIKKGLHKFLCY